VAGHVVAHAHLDGGRRLQRKGRGVGEQAQRLLVKQLARRLRVVYQQQPRAVLQEGEVAVTPAEVWAQSWEAIRRGCLFALPGPWYAVVLGLVSFLLAIGPARRSTFAAVTPSTKWGRNAKPFFMPDVSSVDRMPVLKTNQPSMNRPSSLKSLGLLYESL
jgi:hypothetical protein